jgi:hypothetical protein
LKKKKTTVAATFFDGFAVRKWRSPPFFCGFAAKMVTVFFLLFCCLLMRS